MTARVLDRSRGRGLRGLMIAAAAAALLLGARGQSASAAPPTLTASENPVVIPAPAATKAITLSYDLGGLVEKVMLTVDEVGGPTLLSTAIASQSGSVPLTATYGKSYKAQLINVSTKTAIATLQITTKRPDAQGPGGGDQNGGCRGLDHVNWTIVPHGTYAEIPVTSYGPVMVTVTASTGKPKADFTFDKVESSAITFVPQTSWTGMLPNLTPNTTYYFVITAKDASGPNCGSASFEQGSFKTLTRRVEVTFEKVHVTDNSDFSDHCECTFFFKAGDAPTKQFGEVGIFDNESVFPNAKVTVNNAPDNVTLRVSGFDDDGFGPGFCGLPSDVVADSGSNKCYDWSSAGKTLDVAVSGLGEAFDGTFSIVANGGPLKFTVFGSFKVSYV